jgi:hypothetical protein
MLLNFLIEEIGTNTHESILDEIRLEYENSYKHKERQLHEIYQREKHIELELERNRFMSKIDTIKMQLKSEFDREFRVTAVFIFLFSEFKNLIIRQIFKKDKVSENEIYNQNMAKEQIEINRIEAKKLLEVL